MKKNIIILCFKYKNIVILTKLLIFVFKLSEPNENENIQFSNIIKFNNEKKNVIIEYFELNNIKYILLGLMILKNIEHYTNYCHFYNTNELNLNIGFSYYYADSINGKIEFIEGNYFNSTLNLIIQNHRFILLYGNI